MKVSAQGLIFIMNREATVLSSYRDSVGVWTIGVGHTEKAGRPVPTPGLRITLAEAIRLFETDIKKYEDPVNRLVKVPLSQHQFDALVSLVFNIGEGGFKISSVLRRLNEGNYEAAAANFGMWVKGGRPKRTITGLVNRRRDEQKVFRAGDYGDVSRIAVFDEYPGKARWEKVPSFGSVPKETVVDTAIGLPSFPRKVNWRAAAVFVVVAIIALVAFFAGTAFSQEVEVVAEEPTWIDQIKESLFAAVALVISGAVAYLTPIVRAKLVSMRIVDEKTADKLVGETLDRAARMALNYARTLAGLKPNQEVKNDELRAFVLDTAADYLASKVPDAIKRFGFGDAEIREFLEARFDSFFGEPEVIAQATVSTGGSNAPVKSATKRPAPVTALSPAQKRAMKRGT